MTGQLLELEYNRNLTTQAFEQFLKHRELEHLTLNQLAHKLGYTSIRSLMHENGLDWDE